MESRAVISNEVLARYAADAAREVEGVRSLADSHLRRQKGVSVRAGENGISVELHLVVDYGSSIPPIAREVQQRVRQYLKVMADIDPARVEVVIVGVEPLSS